ncbi:MAG: protein kinase [Sphingomonadales bacterium]|nr:protein kinase [Sphingomonadales bacterium]
MVRAGSASRTWPKSSLWPAASRSRNISRPITQPGTAPRCIAALAGLRRRLHLGSGALPGRSPDARQVRSPQHRACVSLLPRQQDRLHGLAFRGGPKPQELAQVSRAGARQNELDRIMPPLLDALELIHNSDFLHRDIAPDNIIIRKDGSPVLIDFGSARGEIAQHSMTVSALVKPGYSAYEQYATNSRQQGPWSDIYSLGATLYQAVTGNRPPDAPSRMVTDELVPARDAALSSYRPAFLAAIDKALKLEISQRPKSVAMWRKELLEPQAPEPIAETPAKPSAAPLAGRIAAQHNKAAAKASGTTPKAALEHSVAAIRRLFKAEAGADALVKPAKPKARAKAVPSPPIEVKPKAKTAEKAKSERRVEPRPIRSKRVWRPLAIKLMIGLGVASAAVAMQDHFPVVDRRGPITGSTQTASPALPATVRSRARPSPRKSRDIQGLSAPWRLQATGDGSYPAATTRP